MGDDLFAEPDLTARIVAGVSRLQAAWMEWISAPTEGNYEDKVVDLLVNTLAVHASVYLDAVNEALTLPKYMERLRFIGSKLITQQLKHGVLTDPYSDERLREMAMSSGVFLTRKYRMSEEEQEEFILGEMSRGRLLFRDKILESNAKKTNLLSRLEMRFEASYAHWKAEGIERIRLAQVKPMTTSTEQPTQVPPRIWIDRWDRVPTDHPDAILDPTGAPDERLQSGFFLGNDGGPAHDVRIEPIEIDAGLRALGRTLNRIGSGANAFCFVWLEGSSQFPSRDKWDLERAMASAFERKFRNTTYRPDFAVTVSIKYKDGGGSEYCTSAPLSYAAAKDRIVFGPSSVHKLAEPEQSATNGKDGRTESWNGDVGNDRPFEQKPKSDKGDPSILGDKRLVNFRLAERYLGISERQRQNLIKAGALVVEGKGLNRKVTRDSLIRYSPPENPK